MKSTVITKGHAAVMVWQAVRNGVLVRQPCSRCGETAKVEAHHEDYSKPLDVVWLCHSCHKRRHLEISPPAPRKSAMMERISVSLPSPTMAWLKAEAQRAGLSIGELLRRLIDQVRDSK